MNEFVLKIEGKSEVANFKLERLVTCNTEIKYISSAAQEIMNPYDSFNAFTISEEVERYISKSTITKSYKSFNVNTGNWQVTVSIKLWLGSIKPKGTNNNERGRHYDYN